MVVNFEHRELNRQMHLRGGKADAAVFVHRLDHVVDELLKLTSFDPILRHRAGYRAKRRKSKTCNFQNHRVTSLRCVDEQEK